MARRAGIVLMALGVLLMVVALGLFAYSVYAQSQLDRLVARLPAEELAALAANPASQPAIKPPAIITSTFAVQLAPTPLATEPAAAASFSTPTSAPVVQPTATPQRKEAEASDLAPVPTVAALPSLEPPNLFPVTTPLTKGVAAPTTPAVEIRRIAIPSIEVDSRVVELGTKYEDGKLVWETPDHAVGHHLGTAYPGQGSNIVMSGHISSPLKGEGQVFKRLPEVKPGAEVMLEMADGRHYRYIVTETNVVLPSDTWVMDPTPDERLTLITCVPDYVYTHRLIVTAKPLPGNP